MMRRMLSFCAWRCQRRGALESIRAGRLIAHCKAQRMGACARRWRCPATPRRSRSRSTSRNFSRREHTRCSTCVGAAAAAAAAACGWGGDRTLLPRPSLWPRHPPPRLRRCWAAGTRSETTAATSSSCELRPSSPSDCHAPG